MESAALDGTTAGVMPKTGGAKVKPMADEDEPSKFSGQNKANRLGIQTPTTNSSHKQEHANVT